MECFIASRTQIHFASREQMASLLDPKRRVALLTDARVGMLYGYALEKTLKEKGLDATLLSFPSGEQSKTREMKQSIEDALLSLQFDRKTCIIALGGGVVSDLSGFIAATYCRGVSYVCLPTTLLSMIDASIGGKTGVNTSHGKNMIGAFYPSSDVLIDTDFLQTLDTTEWQNGYAEMIKYGLIASMPLFDILEKKRLESLSTLIKSCIDIKMKIIESDFHEKGLRRILNFGHTLGHALEVLLHYRIAHGQAVAMGIAFESLLSLLMGYLKDSDYQRILTILNLFGFRLDWLKTLSLEDLIEAMSRDKKAIGGQPRFVLLNTIGKAISFNEEYCHEVPYDVLKEAYEHFSH